MKLRNIKFFVLVLCFLFGGCSQTAGPKARDKDLIKALDSEDGFVRLRAIQELGKTVDENPLARTALIQRLFSKDVEQVWEVSEIAKVLARAKKSPVLELIEVFRSSNASYENLENILVVLGRRGPKTCEDAAIRFLLEQLAQTKHTKLRGAIRAVSLSNGFILKENTDILLSDMRNRTESGNAAISVMGRGCIDGTLTKDELIIELANHLDKDLDEAGFASLALAFLGERGAPGIKNLTKLLEYTQETRGYESGQIVCGFSLAKIDHTKRKEVLANTLRYMGSEYFGSHTDIDAMALVAPLIDPNILREIGDALDSKDEEVVRGAMWMLWVIGLDAEEYGPTLMKILRNSPDEKSREIAGQALSSVGGSSDISALKSILEKEKSRFVCHEVRRAIQIISLEEPEQ